MRRKERYGDRFEARTARTSRDRAVDNRQTKERFLIVCEGAKTEVNYFESFRVPGRYVHIEGTGRNTLSLVEEAIRLRDKVQESDGFDQCWCVFDRDSFPTADFDNAVAKADANGFRAAYSNPNYSRTLRHPRMNSGAMIGR